MNTHFTSLVYEYPSTYASNLVIYNYIALYNFQVTPNLNLNYNQDTKIRIYFEWNYVLTLLFCTSLKKHSFLLYLLYSWFDSECLK